MNINYILLAVFITFTGHALASTDHDIEVYISTGEVQCGDSGRPIEESKRYLVDAGIRVKAESCGYLTNVIFIQKCGADTDKIHLFTIDKKQVALAKAIGFTASDTSNAQDDHTKAKCQSDR